MRGRSNYGVSSLSAGWVWRAMMYYTTGIYRILEGE